MKTDEVIERQESAAGWAVFSGCEGDDPCCVAFFMGPQAKAMAEELRDRRDEDQAPVIFDAGIAPGVLLSEGLEGGLYASNHYNDEEGIAALSSFSRIDFGRWGAT